MSTIQQNSHISCRVKHELPFIHLQAGVDAGALASMEARGVLEALNEALGGGPGGGGIGLPGEDSEAGPDAASGEAEAAAGMRAAGGAGDGAGAEAGPEAAEEDADFRFSLPPPTLGPASPAASPPRLGASPVTAAAATAAAGGSPLAPLPPAPPLAAYAAAGSGGGEGVGGGAELAPELAAGLPPRRLSVGGLGSGGGRGSGGGSPAAKEPSPSERRKIR
jgi:hypothetical protein